MAFSPRTPARVVAEGELRKARSSLETNKECLRKFIVKEDMERKKEAKKKRMEEQKVLEALARTGMI